MTQAARRTRVDAALDKGHGESFLRDRVAGEIVTEALRKFDGERYRLHAWCVMPNHAHVVVQPLGAFELGAIVKSWKAFSAAHINRALERRGALWAPDYFDRFMRDDEHLATTIAYVERNPVKAGLCATPSEWRPSSAAECGPEGPPSVTA